MPENDALPDDELFALAISENMELRNFLRSGLVEAQGRGADKIPLFVSWPRWLEDGIICMYAKDFRHIMSSIVTETANTVLADEDNEAVQEILQDAADGTAGFHALDTGMLDRVEDGEDDAAFIDSSAGSPPDKYSSSEKPSTAPRDKYSTTDDS